MNNSELQKVDYHKHLGVIFSNNGFWHDHVDYIVKQSYTQLNMLRKVRMTLDRFSLEKIYMSFIRPILEYADVIWDSQNQSLINKLENVQLDAARIVTEGTKLTGFNRLYEETNWLIPSLYILFSLKTHINIYLQQLTTLHGTFSTRDLRFSDDIFENAN